MRVLFVTKRQISWQEWDLNIRSKDLNQLAGSQLELPRKRLGTGRTDKEKEHWESTTGLRQTKAAFPLVQLRMQCDATLCKRRGMRKMGARGVDAR
jgi:hypothetical protein